MLYTNDRLRVTLTLEQGCCALHVVSWLTLMSSYSKIFPTVKKLWSVNGWSDEQRQFLCASWLL